MTVVGALISARGTFVEDHHGRKIATTEGPANHELEDVMKTQSRSAKRGLLLIATGTLLQMIASTLQAIA